ncbi:hypothetical protein L3X38_037213 [Prunus dulcis]|uniref:RNase H type-1 domain-containing protein n=1 Tax=Prunus dulcis TaxID=3755 RepID=A0AAD4V4R7_PRUDU|nr:hypothetical protein L3X38_037213 [Prunus dulcis]
MKFLKESTTMPLPKLSNSDVSKSSVPGFVRPLQDATRREYLPVKRTKEGFDPNAYKLMSKAGYDFGLSSSLGELNPDITGERTHNLSETQKKLKEQGYTIGSARTGLGFTPVPPVKISAIRKEKKAEAQHISVEVVEEEAEPKAIKRASVFDRLAKPTQRTSVFGRIKESISRPSVFKRISRHQNQRGIQSAPRISALERLEVPSQPSEEKKKRELESGVLVDSTEDNEIRSLIPSRMKRLSTLDVTSEKTCLALVFAIQKLRHYMQAFTVHLIARADPVRYVMSKPVMTGRLAKWALLLNQYEIIYTPAKAVKGQVVADFLADHPIPADWEISDDLPDEQVFFADVSPAWMMFFDGSARKDGAGAGVVFVSPERHVLPYSFSLSELCSNNVTEYQALIMGLQMAVEMKISSLEVYGDSMLVINQLLTHYEVRKDDLIPYHQLATQLLESFDSMTLEHVPRKDNQMADALANLAATLALTKEEAINLPVCQRWVVSLTLRTSQEGVNVISVLSIDVDNWRQPLIDYLEHGKLPDYSRHRSEVRRRAPRFIYYKEILYRRSFEGVFLRCLDEEDAFKAMEEAHSGICGAHQSGPKLHFQIKRMGYYWPTMVKDCMDYVKKCQACQFHANFIHQPPEPLHPTITSWPFDAWGLDVVGPIAPKSSDGHSYILAATDYFSKWRKLCL